MKKLYFLFFLFTCLHGFSQAPEITDFSPRFGPPGTVVTITGNNFDATISNNVIWLGNMKCTITAATTTSLTLTIPEYSSWDLFHYTNLNSALSCYSPRKFLINFYNANGYAYKAYTFPLEVTIPATGVSGGVLFEKYTFMDVNNDGKADLLFGRAKDKLTTVINDNVPGSIKSNLFTATDYTINLLSTDNYAQTTVSDWDSDGDLDIMVANPGYTNASAIYKNTSVGAVFSLGGNTILPGSSTYSAVPTDFNNDGKTDILGAHSFNDEIAFFENTMVNTADPFSFGYHQVYNTKSSSWATIGHGDLNNDGKIDAVIGSSAGASKMFTMQNTTAANAPATSFTYSLSAAYPTTGTHTINIQLVDLDADGKEDVVAANNNSGALNVFRNISSLATVQLDARLDFATGGGSTISGFAIGDMNYDGKPDIVVSSNGGLYYLGNTSVSGAITFAAPVQLSYLGNDLFTLRLRDIDGDGTLDIIGIHRDQKLIKIYRNKLGERPVFYSRGSSPLGLHTLSNWRSSPDGINGAPPPDFGVDKDFHLANRTTFTLNSNLNIQGRLFMNGSVVTQNAYNMIAPNIQDPESGGYFKTSGIGTLEITVPAGGTKIFPVGNTARNLVSITNNTGSNDFFKVKVDDNVFEDGTTGTIITNQVVTRTWQITKGNPNAGAGVDFVFNWNNGEPVNVNSPALYHYGGTTPRWTKQSGANTSSTANSLTYTGYMGSFSPFMVGDINYIMPVEWISFAANKQKNTVLLQWETVNEQNTKDFVVQHSLNGTDWNDIGIVNAAFNSPNVQQYKYVHTVPANGNNYYRLLQRDVNDKKSLSKIVRATFTADKNSFSVYPNPVQGGKLNLRLEKSATVIVYNSLGVQVLQKVLPSGNNQIDVSHLAKGFYQVQVGTETAQVMIQ